MLKRAGGQPCLDGGAPDVARDIHEMIPVADQPVEVIFLPERTLIACQGVDAGGRESLPTGDDPAELTTLAYADEDMHVIWHDGPCVEQVVAVVVMTECSGNDSGIRRVPEQAGSMAVIEMTVEGG